MKAHYVRGGLGDSIVKKRLDVVLQELLAPIRARREAGQGQGLHHADAEGRHLQGPRSGSRTADEVKSALGLSYF
jgi:tryptophanyl-tRNA synthetase